MALVKCKECGTEVSTEAKACPKCGAKPPQKMSIIRILLVCLFGFFVYKCTLNAGEASKKQEVAKAEKSRELDNVSLFYEWKTDGFGTVMEADFVVSNNNAFAIKDVEVECIHYAKSGSRIDSNKRIIYDTFPPKENKLILKFNMGFIHDQAEKSSCKVINFSK